MSRNRCCCECATFNDVFGRADSTDINPAGATDWEECAGDWEIYSGTLMTPSANAVVSCNHMVGWPVGIMTAEVVIRDTIKGIDSFGGTAQIFAYVGSSGTPCSGTTGTWRLDLLVTDAINGTLYLYDNTNTLVGQRAVLFNGATTRTMTLCVAWDEVLQEGEITGTCEGIVGVLISTCHGVMPDYYFALGNLLATPYQVYYESATYTDHYDHNTDCPDCTKFCCCPCLEAENKRPMLRATVVAVESATCYIGGESTTLMCSGLPEDCCVWGSFDEFLVTAPLSLVCRDTGETHQLDIMMECQSSPGCEGYTLRLSWTVGGGNDLFCHGENWPQTREQTEVCSCDPLSLTFGPYNLWNDHPIYDPACNCCQEFYIVVTEA